MTTNAKIIAALVAVLVIGIPLVLKSSNDKPAAADTTAASAKKLPRFVDLGTTNCAPCKVMLRVMAELEQQYPGALKIDFVNVKEDPEQLEKYGVKIIPTQIFYSPEGTELFRHTGVFQTQAIVAKWKELGYELAPRKEGK